MPYILQDDSYNVTRFLMLAREPIIPGTDRPFKVRPFMIQNLQLSKGCHYHSFSIICSFFHKLDFSNVCCYLFLRQVLFSHWRKVLGCFSRHLLYLP